MSRKHASPVFQIVLLLVGVLVVAAIIGSLNVGPAHAATPIDDPNWTLGWSEEFNGAAGTQPDPSKWGYEIGYIRNSEDQYYTSSPDNISMDGNGNLVISALRDSRYPGYDYTSASINTKNKAWWTYGKWEMRARIPTASGDWPAWWWLGTSIDAVGWPASGEIDMMEFYTNKLLFNVMNVHKHWYSYTEPFTDSTNYHVWTMIWNSASDIQLYMDGILKFTYTGGDSAFSKPGYMLLNLAIGGNHGGDPSLTTFPQRYYIDYVRVYCYGACAPTATPLAATPWATNTLAPTNTTAPTSSMPSSTPTKTNTPTVTNTPVPQNISMHSQDIYTTDVNGTPTSTFTRPGNFYWRVQVLDGYGNPVSGATVTTQVFQPNGNLWITRTSTTGSDGWAIFTHVFARNSMVGTYLINVTGITKTGLIYDPSANVKASTTFQVQ